MQIIPVEALEDNYIWALIENKELVIVDPGESEDLIEFIQQADLNLQAILLTHKHADHVDGVLDLVAHFPGIEVFGPEEVAHLTTEIVSDGDAFKLLGSECEVFLANGHTEEHVAYLMDNQVVFSGDALFAGGCGRVFTGDYEAQFNSLQKFKDLDDNIDVYGGHEYTVDNLTFGVSAEPDNEEIAKALEEAEASREEDRATYPTTIAKEKQTNVFLRSDSVEQLQSLRKMKEER